MFLADTLKPECEQMIISLTYLSKWVGKQTYDRITKDTVGCGELTAMVAVTKNHLHCQNN